MKQINKYCLGEHVFYLRGDTIVELEIKGIKTTSEGLGYTVSDIHNNLDWGYSVLEKDLYKTVREAANELIDYHQNEITKLKGYK